VTAGEPGRPDTTRPTGPAATEQARRPARATSTAGTGSADPGPAVAAVAQQKPADPTVLPSPRRTIGAVTDQGAVKQCVRGRIDHPQHVLLQRLQRRRIGRLPARIHPTRHAQRQHKLGMEPHRLRTGRLKRLSVTRKQRRYRRRHLITSRRHHCRRRDRRSRIRGTHTRPNPRQLPSRRRQHIRPNHNKRHNDLPNPDHDPRKT
jgi:hypothetical protein